MACRIASDTKLETPEGPFTAKTVLKTPTAVMTRTDDGTIRFAMTVEPRIVGEGEEVLKIVLDNGRSFRIGPDQVLLKKDMEEIAARDLAVGDALENVFSFPVGYVYKTDDGEERTSDGTVAVTSVSPGGTADLYSMKVPRTGRFVLASGVLAKAE